MTDPGARMREVLRDSTSAPALDRDRTWMGVVARQALAARRRSMFRWAMIGVAASLSVVAVYAGRRIAPQRSLLDGPIMVAADSSIQTTTSGEQITTQDALMLLLGHRSSLQMEINSLSSKRSQLNRELAGVHERSAPPEVLRRELQDVEEQLSAAKAAMQLVDKQLSGQVGAATGAPVVASGEHITYTAAPPTIVEVGRPPMFWIAGTGGAIVVIILLTSLWLRRTTRAAIRELAAFRAESGTRHVAVSEAIDAMALEIERIGEAQRFLSKSIGAPATERVASE